MATGSQGGVAGHWYDPLAAARRALQASLPPRGSGHCARRIRPPPETPGAVSDFRVPGSCRPVWGLRLKYPPPRELGLGRGSGRADRGAFGIRRPDDLTATISKSGGGGFLAIKDCFTRIGLRPGGHLFVSFVCWLVSACNFGFFVPTPGPVSTGPFSAENGGMTIGSVYSLCEFGTWSHRSCRWRRKT